MYSDLDLIVKRFPEDMDVLRVYAIGDVHVGAPEFNEEAIKRKIEIIKNDPCGVVALCGDLANFGLKNSKTNCYLETLSPAQEIEYVYELFSSIKDKIVACTGGNHEQRCVRETGIDPMLTLCCRWGIQDVYRENMAITKLSFGRFSHNRQNTFVIITTHGSSKNKHHRFASCFGGDVDAIISGHTHQPSYTPVSKIFVDSRKSRATVRRFVELVVDANLKVGGYGLKNEYEVAAQPELQYLELATYREPNRNSKRHKVVNYHAIQI